VADKKKVRRVRVIEVIDDEDLDEELNEVLEAVEKTEDKTEDKTEEEPEEKPRPVQKKPVVEERPSRVRTLLASSRTTTVLVVALVAALASLAIWQWRQAGALAAEQAERREVAKVAGEYGDSAFSYTAATYKASIDRNQKLLGGDLLTTYKRDTIPNLPTVFSKNPQLVMDSTIKKVYVGDINGKLATAVILVDIKLQTPQGVNDGSNALLRLSLAKEAGGWKITQQAASGQGDDAAGQLPTLPNATSPSPSAKPSD
jgi:hypothetical protein